MRVAGGLRPRVARRMERQEVPMQGASHRLLLWVRRVMALGRCFLLGCLFFTASVKSSEPWPRLERFGRPWSGRSILLGLLDFDLPASAKAKGHGSGRPCRPLALGVGPVNASDWQAAPRPLQANDRLGMTDIADGGPDPRCAEVRLWAERWGGPLRDVTSPAVIAMQAIL